MSYSAGLIADKLAALEGEQPVGQEESDDRGDAERIAQLIAALRDDNEALRDHAMASLGQMGVEAVPMWIGLMADGMSSFVRRRRRRWCVLALSRSINCWRPCAMMNAGDPRAGRQCTRPIPRPAPWIRWMAALKDKDRGGRTAAVWALGTDR